MKSVVFTKLIKILSFCYVHTVTWYATERRKEKINSPTLCVWTNKTQDWPLKGRYELKSNYLHSITYNWLDIEGNVGHCSSPNEIAWPGDIEEEGAKWLARAFRAQNSAFSSEEIWKGIFSFEDRSRWIKTSVYSRSRRMPRKKHRTESLDSSQQKGWPSRFWGLMSLFRKRKELEK